MLINILLIVFGLIGVVAGYKVFKIFLAVSGFIVGFNFVLQLFPDPTSMMAILLAAAAGLFIAIMSYTVYKLGIFIALTVIGMELARIVLVPFGIQFVGMNELWYLVIGIILGATALVFQIEKVLLIFATTIIGAAYFILGILPIVSPTTLVVTNVSFFKDLGPLLGGNPMLLGIFLALFVIGLIVQYQTNFKK